ncbi:BAG family molecular chaperone regulator 1 [Mangifera indica]|uniref:BAG family molecular chaperone regulator 1 n=1 Tax=Mangifera indica TaxID=29780 RepID=UPI001CFB7388|nr:BAG family molecular chaperone regulator 1 [Mangifera indica]
MMKMKTKTTGLSPSPMMNGSSAGGAPPEPLAYDWELRPGGMLVQKRNPDTDRTSAPPPTIRVRVKYGSVYHEMHISSQATFGELKKMLSGPTGLHHEDQKLIYKDKERDSKTFLDMAGVKDRSKIVLVEDPISQEKRLLEMRKNAKMEKASKSISQISLEVDQLGGQVSALESIITRGGKVTEKDVLGLTELLMNQLLKLDGIMADGDVKLKRKMQVKRVQKYVETLDMLKMENSMPNSNGVQRSLQNQQRHLNGQPRLSNGHRLEPIQEQQARHSFEHLSIHEQHQQQQHQQSRHSTAGSVVVTTKWETFDSSPALLPVPSTSRSATPVINNNSAQPKFPWEFFD